MSTKMIIKLVFVLSAVLMTHVKSQHVQQKQQLQSDNLYFPGATNSELQMSIAEESKRNVLNYLSQPANTELPPVYTGFGVSAPSRIETVNQKKQGNKVIDTSLIEEQRRLQEEQQRRDEQIRNSQIEQQRIADERRRVEELRQKEVQRRIYEEEQRKKEDYFLNIGIAATTNRNNINPLNFQIQTENRLPLSNNAPQVSNSQSFGQNPVQPQSPFLGADLLSITSFAWKLFGTLNSQNQNLVLSPILPQLSLAVMEYGAEGDTKRQLQKVVEARPQILESVVKDIRSNPSQKVAVEYASSIFANQNLRLNESFSTLAKERGVEARYVNFRNSYETINLINNWISRATKNTIPQFLDAGTDVSAVEFLLTNAIYFKSSWKYRFNGTGDDYFHYPGGRRKIPFLNTKRYFRTGSVPINNRLNADWVEVPYDSDDYSMVFVVPNIRDRLEDMIKGLTSSHIQGIIGQLDNHNPPVIDLKLPKFDVETRSSLVNPLSRMGLTKLFSGQSELPYIKQSRDSVSVADCIHHAKLTVDETGTIASAANAFSIIPLSISIPEPEQPFIIDQPFLSIIVSKRFRIPLFVSKISNP